MSLTLSLLQHAEADRDPCGDYRRLWESLEKAAATRVEEVMAETGEMTEPFVAYEVARTLPAGTHHIIIAFICLQNKEAKYVVLITL